MTLLEEFASTEHAVENSEATPAALDDDLTVISVDGALDSAIPEKVVAMIEAAALRGPVVIDVSAALLIHRDAVVALGAHATASIEPGECCFVCDRGTGRQLLRVWGITRCSAVFSSIGDARQARVFEASGHGHGWAPSTGPDAV